MEWVAIDIHIGSDPKVHRIAHALHIKVAEVIGYLVCAFGGMAQHAKTGALGDVPDSALETWAVWTGRPGAFAKLFRAELCTPTGDVRAWYGWNGAHIKRADAAAERSRSYRENRTNGQTATPTSANETRTRTHTRTHTPPAREPNGSHTRTRTERKPYVEQDRTGQDREKKPHPLPFPDEPGKGVDPTGLSDSPKTNDPDDVGAVYAAAWLDRYGAAMRTGKSRALLVALEADHDPADVLARWVRYLAATDAGQATASRFAASFAEWQDPAQRPADALGSSPSDEAALLWRIYVSNSLLSQWPRSEYERIGDVLVAQGLYSSVTAFLAELNITEPWTLNLARITDAQATRVIADRLRVARALDAKIAANATTAPG